MPLDKPHRRVVLLGASNVSRSFATLVALARQSWREPIEIMCAKGHGRSYGLDTAVFGRKISGIFPCALWQDLQTRPRLPTVALLTDVGNDLLTGVAPQLMLEWVERCVDRLAEAGARTIVTQLPAESVETLDERRFLLFRRLLFPRSTLTLVDAQALVREVNDRLLEIGQSRKLSVIPVSGSWYGLDPIHVRRRAMLRAWSTMLATWQSTVDAQPILKSSLWTEAYLKSLAPHEQTIFGIQRRAHQPSGRFADGTTIALY